MAHKILMIEDDNFNRKIYSKELRDAGFEVNEAPDGEVGLEMALADKPDLIVLDIIMPKKNGFETLEGLKGTPETAAIPVIMFSQLSQTADKERTRQLGAVEYLVKDEMQAGQLATAVQKYLPV